MCSRRGCCCSTVLLVVRPPAVEETHDRTLWQCLSDILKVDPLQLPFHGWFGSQEFRVDASTSVLGELGRLLAHDAQAASADCR